MFKAVRDAVDADVDIILTLKAECDGRLPIPVGSSDRIAMELLELLDREHGDLTVGEFEDALQSALWWLKTTSTL